jgi:hypothetical protein
MYLNSVIHVNSLGWIDLVAGLSGPPLPVVTIAMKTNKRKIVVMYSLLIEHK